MADTGTEHNIELIVGVSQHEKTPHFRCLQKSLQHSVAQLHALYQAASRCAYEWRRSVT